MPRVYELALLPGDGIGKEVLAEGVKCLQALAEVCGDLGFRYRSFPWGSDYFLTRGTMMPGDGLEILEDFQAVYLGAVGDPRVPDDVTLHGLLLPIKMGFDLYAGLRPALLYPGVDSPLAGRGPGEIDIVVIRENTEGEYSRVGGRFDRPGRELAVQSALFTRKGTKRIITFAFEYARARGRKKVTSITKSNAQVYGMVFWDEIFREVSAGYPEIETESRLIDSACLEVVRNPGGYEVIVASNLFADILSDLTAAVTGGLGLAPGASFNPDESRFPGLFDPVHGSAPDIAGKGLANPIGAALTAGLMLDTLGERSAADLLRRAVSRNLEERKTRTPDLGGRAKTAEVGDDLVRLIRSLG